MKTKLIILVLLIVGFSCRTNNKPLSDAQKEKIKGEVKEAVNTIIQGAEEANFEMALSALLDSPDFVYVNNGKTFTYKEFVEGYKAVFGTLQNQRGTLVDEKYAVLDNSTVLYTNNSRWSMNFKDGHSVLQDPWIMQFTFKKIDNEWKVVCCTETGVEQSVVGNGTQKELNQAELMKQFIGSWKGENAKDTAISIVIKSYGKGLEDNYKVITKGNLIDEGKEFWGYDKKVDKIILLSMGKNAETRINAYWFVTKSKYIGIEYKEIMNPENAAQKMEGEFKSSDMIVETVIVNSKPVRTDTYTRVK